MHPSIIYFTPATIPKAVTFSMETDREPVSHTHTRRASQSEWFSQSGEITEVARTARQKDSAHYPYSDDCT